MRKLLFLLFFIGYTFHLFSQKKRILISGTTKLDSIVLKDIHIINKNTNNGTISNNLGEFEITVKIGDTLFFSHINLKNKTFVVDNTHLKSKKITIQFEENIAVLEGFTLKKQKGTFWIDPSIQQNNGPTVNAKTLGLPYANSKPRNKDAIFRVNYGGILSIDNLINTLNGNKRRKRIVEKLNKEDKQLAKIRNYFTDDFFITDLHIRKKDINPFLNYCVKQNIISLFNKNEQLKLTTVLLKASKSFPTKKEQEVKMALKNN